jgi:hypothetical protein
MVQLNPAKSRLFLFGTDKIDIFRVVRLSPRHFAPGAEHEKGTKVNTTGSVGPNIILSDRVIVRNINDTGEQQKAVGHVGEIWPHGLSILRSTGSLRFMDP